MFNSLQQCRVTGKRSCGRGRRRRQVICRDIKSSRTLPVDACLAEDKPQKLSSCRIPCKSSPRRRHYRYKWRRGPWSRVKYPAAGHNNSLSASSIFNRNNKFINRKYENNHINSVYSHNNNIDKKREKEKNNSHQRQTHSSKRHRGRRRGRKSRIHKMQNRWRRRHRNRKKTSPSLGGLPDRASTSSEGLLSKRMNFFSPSHFPSHTTPYTFHDILSNFLQNNKRLSDPHLTAPSLIPTGSPNLRTSPFLFASASPQISS